MSNTLAVVEKAGNLTIAEEDVLRSRLAEMEEALEKEQGNERAIEDKIKVHKCEVSCSDWACCLRKMFLFFDVHGVLGRKLRAINRHTHFFSRTSDWACTYVNCDSSTGGVNTVNPRSWKFQSFSPHFDVP